MENAFLGSAVDDAAGFIKCFLYSVSITCGNGFSRTADSSMNGRFYAGISGMTSCIFFHRFDVGFDLRQFVHLPNLQEH